MHFCVVGSKIKILPYEMKKTSSPAPQKHNRVNIVSKRKIKLTLINKDKGKRI